MKLKVISTGLNGPDTKIVNSETGESVDQVSKVDICIDANGRSSVTLTFFDLAIEMKTHGYEYKVKEIKEEDE